ncbi:hypothetical protein [Desulfobulbus alkaliphilus]|uniref:hypothetical protein n=1 Tax=Desulfobulbus alkaliphilus TaxID=869814 RepID=UPI001964B77F|nr:hypothetical protein [Desulfobulbus alkaliphilus]MBM9538780.1 hypothetical protein [Desulfobulbus alkaliphilus]
MIRALLFKEWLKIRWFWAAALAIHVAIFLRIFFDIRGRIGAEHAEMVWYQTVHLGTLLYSDIRYLPLLTGLVLAAAQFIPEILGRRLRLTLHLPMHRDSMLLICLAAGLSGLLSLCFLSAVSIPLILAKTFPIPVALSSLPTMLPWILAGVLAYLGGVTLLLETTWPRRVLLIFVFSILIALHYSGRGYGWLTPALPWLIALAPLFLAAVFESGRRFRQRGA